jgi:HAD superfamily hydrolase (TIGR01490 family)
MTTVIFDLDGTVARKDTLLPFLLYCAREFGVKWQTAFDLSLCLTLYFFGGITRAGLKEAFLGSVLSGVSLERLQPIVQRYVSNLMDRGLNRCLFRVLEEHLKRGDRVILATASLDLYVEKLSERLGIQNVVCTRTQVSGGVVTGRILGENCRGPEKVRRLEEYLSPEEWHGSILYTDHHADLPLLQKVSQGFLVNPGLLTRIRLSTRGTGIARVSRWKEGSDELFPRRVNNECP